MKKHDKFLPILAAYATWLVVFGLSVSQVWSTEHLLEAVTVQLIILVLLGIAVNPQIHDGYLLWAKTALIAMVILVLILSSRVPVGYVFIYNIMWIAVAANYFNPRTCWFLLVVVNLAWFGIRSYVWHESDALQETLLISTFYVFALISSLTAIRADQANERTQELNRELLATQHLLSEASKESERTRIARDLHDLVGHHLTALTINLQVAGRLTEGEAQEKVDQCHALSKLLLSDVREAVSTLREGPAVDLHEVLSLAVKDIPKLQINLEMDENIKVDDVTIAEVLLRCVQEAITNSLRHSRAKTANVMVSQNNGSLHLRIQDDGVGSTNLVPGNGLKGMRERIEKLHGSLKLESTPHMRIDIDIPMGVQPAGLHQ